MPTNALTLGRIKQLVWSTFMDNGNALTPGDVAAWVNEAQMDLAARLGLIEREFTGSTTAATLPLPPTPSTQEQVVRIDSLDLDGAPVEFVDDEVFTSWAGSTDLPANTLARVFNGVVEFYPEPDVGTAYELRCEVLPNPVASDTDSSGLPHHLHSKLVAYARYQSAMKLEMYSAAELYLAVYEQSLPDPETGRGKLSPGPIIAGIEPSVFDVDEIDWFETL